jgi:hypothetical protein
MRIRRSSASVGMTSASPFVTLQQILRQLPDRLQLFGKLRIAFGDALSEAEMDERLVE